VIRGSGFVCVNDRDRATRVMQQGPADRAQQWPTDRTEASATHDDYFGLPGRLHKARSDVVVQHFGLDRWQLRIAYLSLKDLLRLFNGVLSVFLLPLGVTRSEVSDRPCDDDRGDDMHHRDIRFTQ
jgi:hypothetical protein